jgi:hypothetical protein
LIFSSKEEEGRNGEWCELGEREIMTRVTCTNTNSSAEMVGGQRRIGGRKRKNAE